jgi:hypothetical protein
MNKISALLILGVFLVAATPKEVDITSFTGTLIDTKCYSMMPKANAGNTHKVKDMKSGKMMDMPNCATACASMGIPVALLTKSGTVHILAAPASQLSKHMAKEARIEGKEMNGVLIVDKLEVKDGNKWSEVEIAYMMK